MHIHQPSSRVKITKFGLNLFEISVVIDTRKTHKTCDKNTVILRNNIKAAVTVFM